jgi:hypothetical protein
MEITEEVIQKALAQMTSHPLKLWHTNPDGTITAINTIGQKFILTIAKVKRDDRVDDKPKPKPQPKRQGDKR